LPQTSIDIFATKSMKVLTRQTKTTNPMNSFRFIRSIAFRPPQRIYVKCEPNGRKIAHFIVAWEYIGANVTWRPFHGSSPNVLIKGGNKFSSKRQLRKYFDSNVL